MQPLTIRGGGLITIFLIALAGCGEGAVVAQHGVPTSAAATSSAAISTPPPQDAIVSTPRTQPTTSPLKRPAPMMFAIRPSFPAGAGGTITVWASSDGVHYHGEVTGLAPGSVHTIHDHAGTCVGGPRSTHLAVLSTASADSHGTLTFDAALPLIDFGPERIVLVYQTGRPTVIAGCATL